MSYFSSSNLAKDTDYSFQIQTALKKSFFSSAFREINFFLFSDAAAMSLTVCSPIMFFIPLESVLYYVIATLRHYCYTFLTTTAVNCCHKYDCNFFFFFCTSTFLQRFSMLICALYLLVLSCILFNVLPIFCLLLSCTERNYHNTFVWQ